MEKDKITNLLSIINSKISSDEQKKRFIKLIVEWILTNDNYKKQCIINGLYNLEFQL